MPWIYATCISSGLVVLIGIGLCIVCCKRRCRKQPRTIDIKSMSSIAEYDASLMREIEID